MSSCPYTPGSSSLHVVFPLLGESALQCFATRSSFTERSGALACDFGQQNDDRQADQPEQNPNRDPTHGFGSLSVMGRFRGVRRLCNVLHVQRPLQKEACTSDSLHVAAALAFLGGELGGLLGGTPSVTHSTTFMRSDQARLLR